MYLSVFSEINIIMWIINFLPDFVFHLILVAGILGIIAGFVLGFIPIINKYKFPIQIISLLLFSFGLYMEGGIAEKQRYELLVKEMEVKVAEAKAQSEKANAEIVEKLVTKTQYIKTKGDTIIKYIETEVPAINDKCVIPEIAIKIHNLSALNQPVPEETK